MKPGTSGRLGARLGFHALFGSPKSSTGQPGTCPPPIGDSAEGARLEVPDDQSVRSVRSGQLGARLLEAERQELRLERARLLSAIRANERRRVGARRSGRDGWETFCQQLVLEHRALVEEYRVVKRRLQEASDDAGS